MSVPVGAARPCATQLIRNTLPRANPSKGGDAEPGDYREDQPSRHVSPAASARCEPWPSILETSGVRAPPPDRGPPRGPAGGSAKSTRSAVGDRGDPYTSHGVLPCLSDASELSCSLESSRPWS